MYFKTIYFLIRADTFDFLLLLCEISVCGSMEPWPQRAQSIMAMRPINPFEVQFHTDVLQIIRQRWGQKNRCWTQSND